MARSFHRRKPLEPNSELNVTALIDLGFALLIIFMISTPLIENEQVMEMELPVASKTDSTQSPTETINLLVTEEGYQIDGAPVNMVELQNELERFGRMADPPIMAVRADGESPYQSVVTLLDLLKKNNLSKINLVTRPEDG